MEYVVRPLGTIALSNAIRARINYPRLLAIRMTTTLKQNLSDLQQKAEKELSKLKISNMT